MILVIDSRASTYERNHLNALSATFAPKLSHLLPPEMVRRVVEYAFDVGGH